MKKLMVVLALSFMLCAPAYAQAGPGMAAEEGAKKQQGMMMDEGMMSMMSAMMSQGMMKGMLQDMMQVMVDMMDMQEKAMMGVKPDEKKQVMMDMVKMRGRMQSMMTTMMGQTPDGAMRMDCAKQWLRKAIDLHVVHLDDPATATEPSQIEMMEQMKKAYACLTDGAAGKEGDATPSKDPHGH